jgi:hypothetical protein
LISQLTFEIFVFKKAIQKACDIPELRDEAFCQVTHIRFAVKLFVAL